MNRRRQRNATSLVWVCVAFVSGKAADAWLQLVDEQGPIAAMNQLAARHDQGAATAREAIARGDTIDNPGALRTETCRVLHSRFHPYYAMAWDAEQGHIGLYRPVQR